ncbi:hypothetical protein HN865_02050 [Candidatus Woesearchaeota archaeon]|jgi:hypothetical protein|nr:hypothetical protein [Candidatus Woesearchaeota archaeon]MBT7237615.1 hypothetical protein [Candidatus Woesearchaeota archaeon]
MKKIVLVLMILAFISIMAITQAQELNTREVPVVTRLSYPAATCEVICNGECPVAPEGWTLSESAGESGGWNYHGAYASGRCFHLDDGNQPEEGVEKMCCYFIQP